MVAALKSYINLEISPFFILKGDFRAIHNNIGFDLKRLCPGPSNGCPTTLSDRPFASIPENLHCRCCHVGYQQAGFHMSS